jgi:RHH-type proline utilization regulon transcriptional repressor/proline dehydrogenase/delta 1-pyrroline-5-carboxylate dehydrogenase
LCTLAKRYDMGLNIDAEEADRLKLFAGSAGDVVLRAPIAGLDGGLGFVIQAYQKRCPFAIDFVVDLARQQTGAGVIRLVRGAYWDSDIKRAQQDGLDGYPVTKPYTDAAYIACARQPLRWWRCVYPQFATHNAHTLAAIMSWLIRQPGIPSRRIPGLTAWANPVCASGGC